MKTIIPLISKLKKRIYIIYNRIRFNIRGIKYGKNFRVYNYLYLNIKSDTKITIGDNFTFTSGGGYNPLCRNIKGYIYAADNAEIIIGNNTGISSSCIWANNKISIGNNVLIGGDTIIMDTDAHNLDYKIRASGKKNKKGQFIDNITANNKPIVIEDDVLIGTRCIILKGTKIGARSIIGSGSIVTKSIPANCIAAGNPCKVIKYINTDDKD